MPKVEIVKIYPTDQMFEGSDGRLYVYLIDGEDVRAYLKKTRSSMRVKEHHIKSCSTLESDYWKVDEVCKKVFFKRKGAPWEEVHLQWIDTYVPKVYGDVLVAVRDCAWKDFNSLDEKKRVDWQIFRACEDGCSYDDITTEIAGEGHKIVSVREMAVNSKGILVLTKDSSPKPIPLKYKAEYDSVIKVEAEYGMVKLEPDAKELLKIVDKHVMNEE